MTYTAPPRGKLPRPFWVQVSTSTGEYDLDFADSLRDGTVDTFQATAVPETLDALLQELPLGTPVEGGRTWFLYEDPSATAVVPDFEKPERAIESGVNAAAIALLQSWLAEDRHEPTEDWDVLKEALDRDRLSGRKLFP